MAESRASTQRKPDREYLLVAVILLVSALAHGINMFGMPQYKHDEGVFMARAWSFVTHGTFDPYTFTYDQTPLGYVQLGGWAAITGGFDAFGNALDSGRTLMLVLQLLSTLCVYCITRTVSRSWLFAAQAALLFALSPYGIYHHRAILLDNIATFWMLVALVLLVRRPLSSRRVLLSAVAMGIAILTKIPVIVLLPACLGLVVGSSAGPWRRSLRALAWLVTTSAVLGLYPLYALMRRQLVPTPHPGKPYSYPSLLDGLRWQASRGRDSGILHFGSSFWHFVELWIQAEPVLVAGGTFAATLCVLFIRQHRRAGSIGLCSFSFWALYGRGGSVEGYYLIALLPLLAINLALGTEIAINLVLERRKRVETVLQWFSDHGLYEPVASLSFFSYIALGHTLLGRLFAVLGNTFASAIKGNPPARPGIWRWLLKHFPRPFLAGLSVAAMVGFGYTSRNLSFDENPFQLWSQPGTTSQRQAMDWVAKHVPTTKTLIVEPFLWTDLHDGAYQGKTWPKAYLHVYAEHNRKVREDFLHNDWRSIDYVVAGRSTLTFAFRSPHPPFVRPILLAQALKHSRIVAAFPSRYYPVWVYAVHHQTTSADG